ncbi:MAG: hypothetical protein ACE5HE_01680 [Phycisphaerae bacterium]
MDGTASTLQDRAFEGARAAEVPRVGRKAKAVRRCLSTSSRQAWVMALVLGAAVVVIHRINPRSLINYHGLVHTAIVYSVLDTGIPPDNPMAAGLPLPYYWVYHAVLAGVVRLVGCPPVAAAEIVNVAALLVMVIVFGSLGRVLLGRAGGGLLALGLALFAVNPLGPLVLVFNLSRGSVDLDVGAFTRSPAHPILRAMYPNSDVRWGGGFFEYLEPSSRCVSYVAAMLTVWLFCCWQRRANRLHGVALALATWTACAMNPIVGTGVAFGLSVGWLVVAYLRRTREPGAAAPGWMPVVWLAAGVLVSLPTYVHLINGDHVGLPVETSVSTLSSKGAVIAWLALVPAGLTLLAHRRGLLKDPRLETLACAGVALLVVSWATSVSMGREHCFFNLGIYLLALPAAAACTLPERVKGGARVASRCRARSTRRWVLVSIAPAACLTIAAFLYRRPIPLRTDGIIIRDTRDFDRAAVYAWLASHTPANAMLVTDVRDGKQTAFYGPESEIPAMTRRALFIDVPGWCLPSDPRVVKRRHIAAAIFDGRLLSGPQRQYVRALGRPLYAMCRGKDDDVHLARTSAPRLFRAGRYSIYRVDVTDVALSVCRIPWPTRNNRESLLGG